MTYIIYDGNVVLVLEFCKLVLCYAREVLATEAFVELPFMPPGR